MAEKLEKDRIVDAISNLTVMELADLVKAIEDKFGVKAAPVGVAMAAAPAAGGAATATEEKDEYTVILKGVPDTTKKIAVIKVIKEITGLGLKESKDLVEGAPKPVKEALPKTQAEELKKKLAEAGAEIELK
ncbi:MAG: 50S ribosomal protein L7/L12 [Elusimicrobia bacterium]|nr:50S ribosomal protein L7/L12 [Elusimicrobiota bacterium]